MIMSWKVLGPIAALVFAAASAVGCTGELVVRSAPPPERVEAAPVAPSAQHFWVRGHWLWNGDRYVWAPGHYEVRRTREVWSPGHWRQVSGGWVWVRGRWVSR